MQTRTLILSPLAILALMPLSGCVSVMETQEEPAQHRPTVGQELIDLQKAKDSGALTQAEYEAAKQKLLQRK